MRWLKSVTYLTEAQCSWASFMEKLGVSMSLTSGYHPQANGQVEWANQEVGRVFWAYCNNQRDWAKFLPWAEYAQNSLRHSEIKLTPFQCMLGYKLSLYLWNTNPTEACWSSGPCSYLTTPCVTLGFVPGSSVFTHLPKTSTSRWIGYTMNWHLSWFKTEQGTNAENSTNREF